MRYRPDLDGIRALAVLAVMASHTGISFALGGWMGVDVFFALSGFLITTLLITEHRATGTVSLRQFYVRRGLRLYPALAVLLVVGAVFYREIGQGGTLAGYLAAAATAGLYLDDFLLGFGNHAVGALGHTWSLAVEEQFYLLWPPIFVLVRRRGGDPLPWAAWGAVTAWSIGALLALFVTPDGISDSSYYLPWSRFSQILAGCALALLMSRVEAPRVMKSVVVGGGAAVALALLVRAAATFGRAHALSWESPVAALLTCALIWHLTANPQSPVRRLLGLAPLAWIGRRSYGLYLIHLPVLAVLEAHLALGKSETAAMMVGTTFVLATISYRFVELPMLRLKRRFEAHTTSMAAAAAL